MEPIIRLADLTKIYGAGESEVQALRGVSLEIWPEDFVALMGPSGSGKSTLMNVIGCLDQPTRGTYLLAGRDVANLDRDALADEPTGNLDSHTSLEIMALFQELGRSGITVVLVTHEPDIAEHASRVITVRDGLLAEDRRQVPVPARPAGPRP